MHVAFVLAGLGAGGAERVVSLISSALVARGAQVTVFAFDSPDEPVYHRFDAHVRLVRLGIAGGTTNVPARIATLRRVIRTDKVDLVVSFLTKINVVTLTAALGLSVRVIVSERNNPRAQKMSRWWKAGLFFLYSRADAIVMQTQRSLYCLPHRFRRSAYIVPNPVGEVPTSTGDPDTRRLVAAGRLTEQKGFDLLIQSFALMASQAPEWDLTIWGEGPERAKLERQIQAAQLETRIHLPGLSAATASWTQGAGIFLLTSRYEGFPNVLLEAMAAGLPVVAFDCDFGPAELIVHGENGLLVGNGDVTAFAEATLALIRDPDRRSKLARAARTTANRYDQRAVVDRWLRLIDQADD